MCAIGIKRKRDAIHIYTCIHIFFTILSFKKILKTIVFYFVTRRRREKERERKREKKKRDNERLKDSCRFVISYIAKQTSIPPNVYIYSAYTRLATIARDACGSIVQAYSRETSTLVYRNTDSKEITMIIKIKLTLRNLRVCLTFRIGTIMRLGYMLRIIVTSIIRITGFSVSASRSFEA